LKELAVHAKKINEVKEWINQSLLYFQNPEDCQAKVNKSYKYSSL
jgi:hypothetical protein